MRLFVGIKLENSVLEQIDKFLKPFKKTASPVKWTELQNLHVTLKFIGEVPDSQYNMIQKKLASADFNTGPLELTFRGCGKFGRGRDMNIFWIGIDENQIMQDVYHRIENSLHRLGIPKEKRPFKPHITVARNKKSFNFKSFFDLIEEKQDTLIAKQQVGGFQLFNSQLTPEGPIYKVLKEVPLDAG